MTLEIMELICNRIAGGEPLYKVCKDDGMPDRITFFKKCQSDSDYAKIYRQALELRGEMHADELTEMADAALNSTSENIQARKLQVNTRQWIISRLLPKKYGDRMTLSGDGENPLVTQLVLGAGELAAKIKGGKV